MSASGDRDVIVATEYISAPPEVVFPYFTDPALITAWIGKRADLVAAPGGRFHLDFGQVRAEGTYVAVEPPSRVVFTWGVPGNRQLPPGSSTVEVRLRRQGDGTLVELTHRDIPAAETEGHRAGWIAQLGQLAQAWPARLLTQRDPASA